MAQPKNWTFDADGKKTPEFGRIAQIVADVISNDHYVLAKNPTMTARWIVARLANGEMYAPADYQGDRSWTTCLETNRPNSSGRFLECILDVTEILLQDRPKLLSNQDTLVTAGKIIDWLVTRRSLMPPYLQSL